MVITDNFFIMIREKNLKRRSFRNKTIRRPAQGSKRAKSFEHARGQLLRTPINLTVPKKTPMSAFETWR